MSAAAKKGGTGFNLEDQIAFYAQYHHNPWNQLIHVICVPAILWSLMVWLAMTGPLGRVDASFGLLAMPFYLNGALLLAAIYALLYLALEPYASFFYLPTLYFMSYGATLFATQVAHAAWWALGVHVAGWIVQFIGHGVAEKRAPALLDSLFQALFLAPLFVWLEVLFKLGYRKDLHKRINQRAARDIAAWRQSLKKSK